MDEWRILLIGGSSGTGKTTLSRTLGQHFGSQVIEGDDLRWAVEAAVPKGLDPDLHLFADADVWDRSPGVIVEQTIRSSRRLRAISEAVIKRHYTQDSRLILEAFWLLPAFTAQQQFAGVDMTGHVRSLFLFDDAWEPQQGLGNQDVALANFNVLVRDEALRFGLPILTSRPRATLLTRAVDLVSST